MKSRAFYVKKISEAVGKPRNRADQSAMAQACLMFAATVANAMSDQSLGFSSSHVQDAFSEMSETLVETFGIDLL